MNIFNILIDLIFSKQKGINININSKNIRVFIPKIYYIGDGKSGSSSIKKGFLNVNVAHWHSVNYFEKIFGTKLLTNNNYDLYDLILYIGNKYNFKPIIIESVRNPINLEISETYQHIKYDRGHGPKCKICQIKKMKDIDAISKIVKERVLIKAFQKKPYSIEMYKKHFNIDLLSKFNNKLNYYFNDTNNCYLLFLKFENIADWTKIINDLLPYNFVLLHENKTTNTHYNKVKQKIKFTEKELQLLNSKIVRCFYTKGEIDKIKQQFIKN
tara:strand:+ start:1158 stop:1967 length:810 start_codon:yes stop_codon:yes gene_type:complete